MSMQEVFTAEEIEINFMFDEVEARGMLDKGHYEKPYKAIKIIEKQGKKKSVMIEYTEKKGNIYRLDYWCARDRDWAIVTFRRSSDWSGGLPSKLTIDIIPPRIVQMIK